MTDHPPTRKCQQLVVHAEGSGPADIRLCGEPATKYARGKWYCEEHFTPVDGLCKTGGSGRDK